MDDCNLWYPPDIVIRNGTDISDLIGGCIDEREWRLRMNDWNYCPHCGRPLMWTNPVVTCAITDDDSVMPSVTQAEQTSKWAGETVTISENGAITLGGQSGRTPSYAIRHKPQGGLQYMSKEILC